MYNVVLVIHVIVAISLIAMILIQRGRSGGLVEALGGVESIFGTKTSSFLVKVTVGLAITFFLTSTSLAFLSKAKGRSLMGKYKSTFESTEISEEVPLAPEDLGNVEPKVPPVEQPQPPSIP